MKVNKSTSQLNLNGQKLKIAIVFSRFNDGVGNKLLKNTVETLIKHKVSNKNIKIVKVPGALEIPIATKILIEQKRYNAIIALGIVIKGKTYHFELVSHESHHALMNLSIKYSTPIVFGIITANTLKQAIDRTEKSKLNKGKEFAETAIEMAHVTNLLRKK